MNRSVIAVKQPNRRWIVIRIHWGYGEELKKFLEDNCPTEKSATEFVMQGHRSDLELPYTLVGFPIEYETFNTLKEARDWCEYYTFGYFNGNKWRFEDKV